MKERTRRPRGRRAGLGEGPHPWTEQICVDLDHARRLRRHVDHEVCASRTRGPLAASQLDFAVALSTAHTRRSGRWPSMRTLAKHRQSLTASAKTTRDAVETGATCHGGLERGRGEDSVEFLISRCRGPQRMRQGATGVPARLQRGPWRCAVATHRAQMRCLYVSRCRLPHMPSKKLTCCCRHL